MSLSLLFRAHLSTWAAARVVPSPKLTHVQSSQAVPHYIYSLLQSLEVLHFKAAGAMSLPHGSRGLVCPLTDTPRSADFAFLSSPFHSFN